MNGLVSSLALGLFHRPEPRSPFMILAAYLDESGTHGEASPITVMAGYYADVERWASFDEAWGQLLRRHGLTSLHTHSLFHGSNECAGLDWPNRKQIANEALAIARRSAIGFVVAMNNLDYREIVRHPSVSTKLALDSRYGACLRSALAFLAQSTKAEKARAVHIIAESGHKNVGAALELLNQFRLLGDPDLSILIETVVAADSNSSYGLQAADLLAYSAYRVRTSPKGKQLLGAEDLRAPAIWEMEVSRDVLRRHVRGLALLHEIRQRYGKHWRLAVKRETGGSEGDYLLSRDPFVVGRWFQGLPRRQWLHAPGSQEPARWPLPSSQRREN